jgi:esterase/lipase superfamily enzyme
MYFITNKTVREEAGNKLKFQESNELSQSLRYCHLLDDELFEEIGSKSFMEKLMKGSEKEILFFVHGFNNQPYDTIFPRARNMQTQLEEGGLGGIAVVPIIWPCDDDFGIIQDYWDDQESAEFSGIFFSRAISKLTAWQDENVKDPCKKRMHVFAHSMGARVLMKCLSYWAHRYGGGGVPYLFKNIFLMASDIPNDSLEKSEEGTFITKAAQRVICYFANDDFSMPASKVANVKNAVFSRRIGHTGPEDMSKVPNNVYAVNCDSFNNKFDKLKGHSYFIDKDGKKSPAFQHVLKVLKTKKPQLEEREVVL